MKKIFILLLLALPLVVVSCKDDDDDKKNDPQPVQEITLTQAAIDAALNRQFGGKTGVHVNGTDTIPTSHIATIASPDSTNRGLYTSYPVEMQGAVQPNAVLAKRVFKRNPDGTNGDLLAVFIIHKQNSGYFSAGGDQNYYVLPGTSVTEAYPNGQFSQAMRDLNGVSIYGKSQYCADCHSRGGSDYLFSR